MKLKDEFWAFIPARSGSKSIKDKNIKKLNNLPLIAYSLKVAKKIKKVKKIVFSSDSKKYFKIAEKYGFDIAHNRDKSTSSDNSDDLCVFQDFLKKYNKINHHLPKYFVHLRPTTPIRYASTLNKSIEFFLKNKKNYSSMRSIKEMPETSFKSLRILEKKLCSILKKDFDLDKYNNSSQLYTTTYDADGTIDIYKTKNILKGTLLGNKVLPFTVKDLFSNIDNLEQFEYVEYLIKKIKYKV